MLIVSNLVAARFNYIIASAAISVLYLVGSFILQSLWFFPRCVAMIEVVSSISPAFAASHGLCLLRHHSCVCIVRQSEREQATHSALVPPAVFGGPSRPPDSVDLRMFLASAIKFSANMNTWLSVDTTTSGHSACPRVLHRERRASGRRGSHVRWRTIRLSRSLFGTASVGGMSLVHGVDAHFAFVPPPTGTASFCFSASVISIGLSAAAARSLAEDAGVGDIS